MCTGQSAVMLCGCEVKAGITPSTCVLNIWAAGKTSLTCVTPEHSYIKHYFPTVNNIVRLHCTNSVHKRWPIAMIQYHTIHLHALKSWRNGQLSLAHSTEIKKLRKNYKQKPISSKEMVRAKVRESSLGARSETMRGVGFMKQVGFKL